MATLAAASGETARPTMAARTGGYQLEESEIGRTGKPGKQMDDSGRMGAAGGGSDSLFDGGEGLSEIEAGGSKRGDNAWPESDGGFRSKLWARELGEEEGEMVFLDEDEGYK
ncbi:hypothetical protein ACA910_018666 [Epithemia clementina (nom. ined.)]